MSQERKKKQKLIANRLKQRQFTAKYGVYNTPSKFIEKVPPQKQQVNPDPSNPEPTKPEPTNLEPTKPEPTKPDIKEFYAKLSERMGSTEITAQVKSEITDIIKAAGITEQQDVDKFVEKSYSDIRKHVNFIYDPKLVSETKMSIDAPSFFYVAYQSLMESSLSAPDQIIAAQKIANVMIKNYSPVAFADKGFEHYGNDYVLNSREELETQLRLLKFLDTNAMAEEVYATLRGEPIKKPEPPKPEPVDPDSVDMAAFTKGLQPMLDDAEEYKSFNVFRRIAIKNILKEAGVDVGEESDPLGYADVIKDAYAPEKLSREAPQPMRNVAKSLFVATYNALTQKGINPTNKIETTQKLTNEFITHYSPAILNENLLKYANNYVTNDNELFRECLTALKFPENEIKAIVDDRIDGARLHNSVQFFTSMPSTNAKINSNISDILKMAEVGADKTNALEINEILADAYTPDKIPNTSIPMRDVTKQVFMSTYAAMTKKGVAPKNKVETAQKIADVLLKNYSPIAYTDQKLNQYADNYVINDKKLLRECLKTLKVPENEIKAIAGDVAPEAKPEVKTEAKPETKPIVSEARVAVYEEKLKAYNNMYKLDMDSNHFASSVIEAWELMTSGDKQKMSDGQKVMNNLFKDTLKKAFDVEKDVAYNEHRLPEYAEIVKSTNELMRSAMYALTDLYHDPNRKNLFESTAFGGLTAKDMGDLTVGDSLWEKDQKSDEAWELQAKEAKNIADKWLKEDKPYEKMVSEMKALVTANNDGIVSRKEMLDKLTAAEWLLINNEKMMVEDPEDPLNPIPNWGNRYWKALAEAREALGINKHTSMRELIQSDYSAMAKAVGSVNYNKVQIQQYVLDEDVRELSDSMEAQKEAFTAQSRDIVIKAPSKGKAGEKNDETEADYIRKREPVESENEREKMKREPKVFSNFQVQKVNELKFDAKR